MVSKSEPSLRKLSYCCIVIVSVVNFLSLWIYVDRHRQFRHVVRCPSDHNGSVQQAHVADLKARGVVQCSPSNHVLFLKTHKTGSSTVTNILNRYGYRNNLSFVLPAHSSGSDFEWPSKFRLSSAASLFFRDANIMCNHARFTPQTMHWLFPKDRSRYITIIREPVKQFESFFYFMDIKKELGLAKSVDPLAEFFTTANNSFERLNSAMKHDRRVSLIRNPMLFDLGLDFKHYANSQIIQDYTTFLDREFDLVMILEHFDESLVLLKRLLCWSTQDILYFKLNERLDKDKRLKRLSQTTRKSIHTWNSGDLLLYQYFNNTLWRKIQAEGPEFYKELAEFRRQNVARKKMCLTDEETMQRAYQVKYVKGYSVKKNLPYESKELCEQMTRTELAFLKILRHQKAFRVSEVDELPFESEEGWDTL